MALDPTNRGRSYLYGRLLAIADAIESYALFHRASTNGGDQDPRPTNAFRMMARFTAQPAATWITISNMLTPSMNYIVSHCSSVFVHYDKQLSEIISSFEPADFTSNARLDGEFMLGYYCQRQDKWDRINQAAADKAAKTLQAA